MIKRRNLDPGLARMLDGDAFGGPGVGDVFHSVPATSATSQFINWLQNQGVDEKHHDTSFPTLYNSMVSGRNDCMLVYGGGAGITLSADPVIAKNMCRFVGTHAGPQLNMRSRIGHDANFATLMTISGYGNLFENIYWMHGRGSATNLTGLSITGHRNAFINCHIGGPMNATESAEATYQLVKITGQENYFGHCVLGIDTIARSAANSILGTGSGSARNIFEDCIFLSMSSATSPFMISVAAGSDRYSIFKNCQFINFSANWASPLAYLVTKATTTDSFLIFDGRCGTFGITDIIAAARIA
ncbi:MAG TPA: hypothetical protein ACFYD4_16810, partial [Candidatus Wunengus sp. YC61]|uniref:hypothetical protein n=1 Tax=Candidatus Wunengus sp. YC61 TaxID=3367698 RepID=UPI004028DB24